MPRKARLNVTGTVAHIMARSLSSEVLFNDDEDRSVFVSLFGKYLDLVDYRCYAWVLMSNHFHLVVRTSDQDLWGLMKPLNTSYARYHKKKYKRDGPLFRDRYKSIVTQEQNYIEELVRYVHLNPIRAGVCKDLNALDNYPWSGHSVLMGRKKRLFQDSETVLRRFGNDNKNARIAYRKFLQEGLDKNLNGDVLLKLVRDSNKGKELGRQVGCWVIGDDDFVKSVLAHAECSFSNYFRKNSLLIPESFSTLFPSTFQPIKKCAEATGLQRTLTTI